jgi:amidophosphoribosyltransferase
MATHSELIASTQSVEEIRRKLGADALCYQTINGLIDAIGFPRHETCLACLTGAYPTPLAQKIADEMQAKPEDQKVRYWER